jgi:hypothetical protein
MSNYIPSNFWAHMRLLRTYWEPLMLKGLNGVPYVADSHGTRMMELQCDCGHTWSILKEDFPGRRKLTSCGRVECPHSYPKPKRGARTGVNFTTYYTADNHEWLEAKANATGSTKSHLVNQLIDRARADDLLRE